LGTIKSLFHTATKVLTHRDQDEPPPARRRSGETEGEFRRLARKIARRFDVWKQFEKAAKARAVRRVRTIILSPDEWGAPDAHLTNTNDLLQQLWNNDAGSDYGGSFDTNQNHICPHL
jgi:hypothetical protein